MLFYFFDFHVFFEKIRICFFCSRKMKINKVFFCIFSIFSFGQVIGETITIHGVVDDTPGQSYSKAGGAIAISGLGGRTLRIGPPAYKSSMTNFSKDLIFEIVTHGTKETEHTVGYITNSMKSIDIAVYSANSLVTTTSLIAELLIPRDPKNSVDRRYRIRVTSFTPGPTGTTGQGKVTAEFERIIDDV